jgi:2'-5' RNA ligase
MNRNWYKIVLQKYAQKCEGWMAVRMDKGVSKKIQDWGKKHIPDDIVYNKEGHGRETDTHITLMYGICSDDPSIIKKIVNGEKPIKATLGKIGFFKPDDKTNVVIIKVDSPDLEKLNKKINKILNVETTFDDYKPHCTIAYIKDGNAMRFAGDTYFDGMKLVFNKIVFKNNKNEEVEIVLK